ncbi:MAG: hypothetical protein CVU44_19840 [Chloroflexi bacterium HGW-Chloroflexi-6]|nr:MAG: hypothetical protein CVU44_19840 [Chloroflexi bacterium HGW-Chloroflexi-6]
MAIDLKAQLDQILEQIPSHKTEEVQAAYRVAHQVHAGSLRSSQQPFFEHVLKVAYQIACWAHDPDLTIAALLHDSLDDDHTHQPLKVNDIEKEFGGEIAGIVELVHYLGKKQEKNLFWGIEDPSPKRFPQAIRLQALLIKLASGEELAQGLRLVNDNIKRTNRSQILLSKYVPLAAQLGMWDCKRNLNDVCLNIIAPQEYEQLQAYQNELCEKHLHEIQAIENDITHACHQNGLQVEILIHRRHIYSLYKQVGKKWGPDFETITRRSLNINQVLRFNVIAPNIAACYQAIQFIHEYGAPVKHSWRDFLAQPKPNGYASLHTAIRIGKQQATQYGFNVFTPATLEISKHGLLFAPELKLWRFNNPEILESLPKTDGTSRCIEALFESLSANDDTTSPSRISVFTPHGKRIYLPKGSTPLDFAYHLHTELGNKFDYAIVNHAPVAFGYSLCDGEVVEIFTKASNAPREEWLDVVFTESARNKIKQWLRKTPRSIGETRFQQSLQARGLEFQSQEVRIKISDFLQKKSTSLEKLFEEIGRGHLNADAVYTEIWEPGSQAQHTKVILAADAHEKVGHNPFWIKLSGCCKPVFPDDIIGCIHDERVTVHKINCAIALRARKHIHVKWEQKTPQPGWVHLKIQGNDRPGLVRDIAGVIANHFYNMGEFRASTSNGHAWIEFSLELPTPAVPEAILKDLRAVLGVNAINLSEETLAYLSRNPPTSKPANVFFNQGLANPYSPGRPIFERAMFFGRQQEIRSITQYLMPASQPTSILLCAQRRAGKTSLGLHIKNHTAITREYLPVFLDVSTARRDSDVKLLRKISQHIQLRVRDTGAEFEPITTDMPLEDAYFHFEQNLENLQKQLKKRILLILDEFEAAFDAYRQNILSLNFFIRLRSWSQLYPVTFLIIGSHSLLTESAHFFPDFSNVFLAKPLGGLRELDARRLIVEPSQFFLNYDDNAIERILSLTQCYPYYIHLICASLFNQAGKISQTLIGVEQVETVQKAMCTASARGNYAHLWNPDSPCHELALAAIAARTSGEDWIIQEKLSDLCDDDFDLETALRELTDLETLEKRSQGNSFEYRIRLPLFTGWILNNWPLPYLLSKRHKP